MCKRCIWIVFAIGLVLSVCTGCKQKVYKYSFYQSIDNVEKVEICGYDYYTHTVTSLKVLGSDDAKALLDDITALECYKHFGDHVISYGVVVVYITYLNGEAEVIGFDNTASIDHNGEWWISSYNFNDADFCSMILKYINKDQLPDLSPFMK